MFRALALCQKGLRIYVWWVLQTLYICEEGDMSVVKRWSCEKMNQLVTCFSMESIKPFTVESVHYAIRSTQEQLAGNSETNSVMLKILTGKDALKSVGPLTCQLKFSIHSTYNITTCTFSLYQGSTWSYENVSSRPSQSLWNQKTESQWSGGQVLILAYVT